MSLYPFRGLVILGAVVSLGGACAASKSSNPTAPSVAGPIPGVAITAPRPLEPGQGATLVFEGPPPTLLIENPSSSGQRTWWIQLELASDANFRQIVHQADRITPGDGGRTTYRLPEPLGAGFTYHWRARAADGANIGPYSFVSTFTVVPPVIIDTPSPAAPTGRTNTIKPDFVVANGAISGTTGVIYRFEIGNQADMSGVMAVITVPPGDNGRTTMNIGELPYKTTFYWRVYATDGTKQSPYSSVYSFTTPDPPVIAPPPGGGGGPSQGVPLGPGGRTPDPQGGRLPLPSYGAGVVSAVARANPGALANSCQEHGGSWQFLDLVVDTLRTYDARWGYNGKRGNANDPSLDVITYHYGPGPEANSTDVYIVDVIAGHCGASPSPYWNDVTDITVSSGAIGRWISRGRF